MKKDIRIAKAGCGKKGYRIAICAGKPCPETYDAWIPELAPRQTLQRRFDAGLLLSGDFEEMYADQLRTPFSQKLLKPLALLSMRRQLILLCDCAGHAPCKARIIAAELRHIRAARDFVLFGERR